MTKLDWSRFVRATGNRFCDVSDALRISLIRGLLYFGGKYNECDACCLGVALVFYRRGSPTVTPFIILLLNAFIFNGDS